MPEYERGRQFRLSAGTVHALANSNGGSDGSSQWPDENPQLFALQRFSDEFHRRPLPIKQCDSRIDRDVAIRILNGRFR